MSIEEQQPRLHLVASQQSDTLNSPAFGSPQSARTGQWSADGTSIVHVKPGNIVETTVLPEDLLDDGKHHDLGPYSRFNSADPIYSSALYPQFSLREPSTTLMLYAARDTPIQLRNALNYDQGIYATYAWCDPYTEVFITPRSLIFNSDATHFIAGARAQFAVYDVNSPSAKAIRLRKTSRSRYATKTFGEDPSVAATAPGAHITAMDISSEDILAVGSNSRHVALYADHGLGDLVTSFKLLPPTVDCPSTVRGVTQVKWSADGTYLFIAERQSDIIELYDIRQSCRRLSWLSGRQANANFQLSFDVVPTLHGLEVWGGGIDGRLRMWSHPEQQEGAVKVTEEWHVHDDPVCSTLVHSSGTVVATLATKDRYAHRSKSSSVPSESSDEESSDEEINSLLSSDDEKDEVSESSSKDSESTRSNARSSAMLKVWSIS